MPKVVSQNSTHQKLFWSFTSGRGNYYIAYWAMLILVFLQGKSKLFAWFWV